MQVKVLPVNPKARGALFKMRVMVQALALIVVLAASLTWLVQGANRGWTKTSVSVTTLDEVTGIEGITTQEAFLPGVDFLAAALLASGLLAGGSLFIPKTKNQNKTEQKQVV